MSSSWSNSSALRLNPSRQAKAPLPLSDHHRKIPVSTKEGRPTNKKRKAPQVSKLVMMKDRSELQCVLPRSNGKLRAIWIARYDVVATWLSGAWRHGVATPYALGALRMVASTSPDGRQVSVAPPVDALRDCRCSHRGQSRNMSAWRALLTLQWETQSPLAS